MTAIKLRPGVMTKVASEDCSLSKAEWTKTIAPGSNRPLLADEIACIHHEKYTTALSHLTVQVEGVLCGVAQLSDDNDYHKKGPIFVRMQY